MREGLDSVRRLEAQGWISWIGRKRKAGLRRKENYSLEEEIDLLMRAWTEVENSVPIFAEFSEGIVVSLALEWEFIQVALVTEKPNA